MQKPIYLDGHSTTAVDSRVFEEMRPWFTENFGNASSKLHAYGWEAEAGIDIARKRLGKSLSVAPDGIVFTSSATEANHLAICGLLSELKTKNKTEIISLAVEHASVLGALELAKAKGFTVHTCNIDKFGRIDLKAFKDLLTDRTGLVTVAWANHEIGTIQPLPEIVSLSRKVGAWVHSDAVQAFGKISLNLSDKDLSGTKQNVPDLLTLSAHKVYGPKGVGALIATNPKFLANIEPIFRGGNQEFSLRPGTQNVPAIIGFGKAAELATAEFSENTSRLARLRNHLWQSIHSVFPGKVRRNGCPEATLPNNLNISFMGIDGSALFSGLKKIAVSNASACLNAEKDYSAVLSALGLPKELARASLRIGLTKDTTDDDIAVAIQEITAVVQRLHLFEASLDNGNRTT